MYRDIFSCVIRGRDLHWHLLGKQKLGVLQIILWCPEHTLATNNFPARSVNSAKTEKPSSRVINVWISRNILIIPNFFINWNTHASLIPYGAILLRLLLPSPFFSLQWFPAYILPSIFSFKTLTFSSSSTALLNPIPTLPPLPQTPFYIELHGFPFTHFCKIRQLSWMSPCCQSHSNKDAISRV